MSGLEEVRKARAAADAAAVGLRKACLEAVSAGQPIRQVAIAAGASRDTIYRWRREAAQKEMPRVVFRKTVGTATHALDAEPVQSPRVLSEERDREVGRRLEGLRDARSRAAVESRTYPTR